MRRFLSLVVAFFSFHALASSQDATRPTLESILGQAANYLERYEREVTAFTAQETYTQRLTELAVASGDPTRDRPQRVSTRRLLSEFLIVADASGWVEYRDVFEVDSNKVRDHDERLMRLFTGPSADAKTQGYRIADESARFNLLPYGAKVRLTLNVPMTALRYLRRANQSRSSFSLGDVRKEGSVLVANVRFSERSLPPLVGFAENARANGIFWIDVGTGAVTKTQLWIASRFGAARTNVEYAVQPGSPLWLPNIMEDSFALERFELAGHASYSNYKQFKVDTSTEIKR